MGKVSVPDTSVCKKTRMQAGRLLYPLDFYLLRSMNYDDENTAAIFFVELTLYFYN